VSTTRPAASAPPAPTDLDGVSRLGLAFRGTSAALRRLRGRESQRPGALSDAQYTLLFGLRDHEELSSRELAALADLSPATTTEMLESLDAAGLVHRHRSELDRRVVLTSLTDRGRDLVEERRARFEPRWRAALEDFTDAELLVATSVLERLRDMFDKLSAEGSGTD
jgi:DNA-binding MarR family transcriptional regulator